MNSLQRNRRVLAAISVLVLALALTVAGLAGAHGSKSDAGLTMSFGGLDEPNITGERTWLTVNVADEATKEPVEGLEKDKQLTVTVSNGEWARTLTLSRVSGTPGLYKAAIWFQAAGKYTAVVKGVKADGTPFTATFDKTIADHRDLFFPPLSGR